MGREQHYVGLHYRTKFQIGATNVTYGEDDYFDGSDQKFQFSHPRTSIKDELSPVQLPLKIQKQKKLTRYCIDHPTYALQCYAFHIDDSIEYGWYCPRCKKYFIGKSENGDKVSTILKRHHYKVEKSGGSSSLTSAILILQKPCRSMVSSRAFLYACFCSRIRIIPSNASAAASALWMAEA